MSDDEPKLMHAPGTCWECDQYRSLLAALRHFENKKRFERPKTKIEFSPFGAIKW